ncbi:MAG: ribonuclease P protein component [Patescibacteria group bacterium]
MLSRKYSLRAKDFGRILKQGRIFNTPYFRLRSLPNNFPNIRVGIIISAKVSKKAVLRNRLKRQISEIFRLNFSKLQPGYDIVITVSGSMVGKKYQEIKEEVLRALKTIKLF